MALSGYDSWAKDMATGVFTWVAGTYNIMLMSSTYTFSAAHNFRDDITNEMANGNGYATGGLALDNKSASAANPTVLTADDEVVAQNASGFTTARKYAIAKILGGASSADPLVAYGLFGADVGNVAGPLTLDVPSSFITITV